MPTMKDIDDIKRARELVNKGWCQKSFARNSSGDKCPPTNSYAISFCALGAFLAIDKADIAFNLRIPDRYISITEFNDVKSRTKEEVLAVFDKTILELLEQIVTNK